MMAEGPDGEIGRRSGLKIRGPETAVGVQVSLRAPICTARYKAISAQHLDSSITKSTASKSLVILVVILWHSSECRPPY
jgi:hypothetical protein